MPDLPTGTVTFLFTDIEGSTRLLRETGDRFPQLLDTHARLIRDAIDAGGGVEVRTEGDAFFVAFPTATGAAHAAITAQRSLSGHEWPPGVDLRVRMGMHTGVGALGGDDYVGIDVHLAARVASAAHGGQIVLSESTMQLVDRDLPDGVSVRDLGAHQLKDMPRPERIYQLDVAGLRSVFPALDTLDVPSNLPTDLTEFVGRRDELEQAIELLGSTRLLTLTGPGGAGKTRLGVTIAAAVMSEFSGGVFFVGLEQISDASLIPGIISDVIGAPPAGGDAQIDRLRTHLGSSRTLLVLDNLEQVDEPAPVIGALLGGCPGVKIVATSRTPVHVSGEQEMAIPTMSVPPTGTDLDPESILDYDSVRLFARRASSVRPDFEVTADNGNAIVALCQALDGLPLAIEIAAARVKLLPPATILERLDRLLDTQGRRDVPARQQTLRNAIQWSHDLLDPPLQGLFRRLSVFAGGGWLAELEAVGHDDDSGLDVLDGISRLVDHSLVSQSIVLGEPRFRMLETIREFAHDQLRAADDTEQIHERHAEAYLAVAERAQPELTGPRASEWIDRLTLDRRNIESALAWAIEAGRAGPAQRLAGSFWRFWQMRGHLSDALPTIEATLALSGPVSPDRARASEAAGGAAYWLSDMERARRHYEDALAYWRASGDDLEVAHALFNLSYPVGLGEGPEPAIELLEEALAIYRDAGHRLGMARVNRMLGVIEATRGNHAAWAVHAQQSLELFDEETEPFDFGWSLFSVAGSSYLLGDIERSEEALRRGLELFDRVADVSALLLFLFGFVQVADAKDQLSHAARLAGALSRLSDDTGSKMTSGPLVDVWLSAGVLDRLEREHPEPFAAGRAMTADETLRYALADRDG